MALEVWPATLPQDFTAANYAESLSEGVLKDEYNVGPPSYRRRTTAAPANFSGTMVMSTAEWIALRTFFHTNLFDGALRFLFPPQATTDTSRFWITRFVNPPKRQLSNADDLWFVSLEMELLGTGKSFISPSLFEDPDTFYAPTLVYDQILTVALRTDPDTFYVPSVSNADQFVTASFYTDADTFFAPSVASTQVEYIAISFVQVGAFTAESFEPSAYTDPESFFIPAFSGGVATPQPNLYTDPDTVYSPTVARGVRTLTASLYSDADSIFAPSISLARFMFPVLLSQTDTFYAPQINRTAKPALYSDADAFYVPAVARGVRTLTANLYSDTDTFYVAVVTQGAMLAPLITDADTFYVPAAARGVRTLTTALYTDADSFYVPSIQRFMFASLYTDADTVYAPTVTATSPITSLTLQDSATSTASTITAPASIIAGDLLVLVDYATNTTGTPTTVTPTGFTLPLFRDLTGATASCVLSYKIAIGNEDGATITGMNGTASNRKILLQLRPNTPITSVTADDSVNHSAGPTNNNPAVTTLSISGATAPALGITCFASSGAVDPRTTSITPDNETNVSGNLYIHNKFYASGAITDYTWDMDDEGNMNTLIGFWASLSSS